MRDLLNARRKFVGLVSDPEGALAALMPLIGRCLPSVLNELRARLSTTGDPRFTHKALSRAAAGQLFHWQALAGGQIDDVYMEASQAIAAAHLRIGLEPQWYVDAQGYILSELVRYVIRDGPSAGLDADAIARGAQALILAVILDIDLTLSFYRESVRRDERASAERLRVALHAASAGVFEFDNKTKTVWCSPDLLAIMGRSLSDHDLGDTPWQNCHPEDRPRVEQWMNEPSEGPCKPIEFRVILPSGAPRWLQAHIERFWDDDGALRKVIGFVLNIDQRKEQELALIKAEEAALAAARAKAQFLATMSHEIRTPMNGVLGILHILQSEQLTPSSKTLLDQAEACGRTLSQLLDDILDLSKIEAGQLELRLEPINPADLLESIAELLRPTAEAKGIALEVDIKGGSNWVQADPVRLRQALFNLIGNAIKFTLQGGVQVCLTAVRSGERVHLRFEIADTGVGIAQEDQGALFERFHQAESTASRRFDGSGLGLAITRDLVRLMGGDIGFRSQEGQGSVFWFEFSTAAAQPVQPEPVAAKLDATSPFEGVRILVVEDNPTNRTVVEHMLGALGSEIHFAIDGLDSLSKVENDNFDLILMDVHMPKMDGLEATRRIRMLDGPVATTPIIGLTADAQTSQREACLKAGMNAVVSKPIVPSALFAEISRWLNKSATNVHFDEREKRRQARSCELL